MKTSQNIHNHRRFDARYHFVLLPLSLALLTTAIILFGRNPGLPEIFYFLSGMALFLLSLLVRDYPKRNQDRIIRMEMRFRYYLLTGETLNPFEEKLTLQQLAALRFAGDHELPELIKSTIREDLSPQQIKERIQHWQSDHQRV